MFWQLLRTSILYLPVFSGTVIVTNESFAFTFITILGLFIAITIHEFAHAWSANLLGDPTAKYEGRLTLNPVKHFDLFGFVLILFAFIGYGKPVPVNPNNFKNPVQGLMFVSLAGPASNLLQAVVCGILFLALRQLPASEGLLTTCIYALPTIGAYNLALMVFNLLPIPPLDGSKIWGYFNTEVDNFINYTIAPYAFPLILLLVFPLPGTGSLVSLLIDPFMSAYLAFLN